MTNLVLPCCFLYIATCTMYMLIICLATAGGSERQTHNIYLQKEADTPNQTIYHIKMCTLLAIMMGQECHVQSTSVPPFAAQFLFMNHCSSALLFIRT